MTMGGGAFVGKAFNTISSVVQIFSKLADAAIERRSLLFKHSEDSRIRAEKTNGGVFMRRAIYLLIALGFMAVVIAPFFGHPVVVENLVQKGMLFWKKTVVEYTTIEEGVLFLDANRRAFFALVAFYLGAKA